MIRRNILSQIESDQQGGAGQRAQQDGSEKKEGSTRTRPAVICGKLFIFLCFCLLLNLYAGTGGTTTRDKLVEESIKNVKSSNQAAAEDVQQEVSTVCSISRSTHFCPILVCNSPASTRSRCPFRS